MILLMEYWDRKMTPLTIAIVSGSILALIGGVISFIAWSFKRSIVDKIDELEKKVTDFKEDMLKYYVTKEDFKLNTDAHKELWIEVRNNQTRLTKLEK